MDFTDLQVFKAVVDEGGIGRAARRLHRVQSNITVRIQQLEASLGVALFIRERRRLHLSPAGMAFRPYADAMLRLADEARGAALGSEPRGTLRLGTLESTAASRLGPLLAQYHAACPEVRVELATGTTDGLVEAVQARRLDAAFVADWDATTQLQALTAFREQLVLVAARTHAPIRRPRDVGADTIIAFPSGCAYRRRLQAWLGRDDVVPDRFLELASYHAILACVAAGAGIAIVPRAVLDTMSRRLDVAVHPLGGRAANSITSLVWRREEASPALKALHANVSARPSRARSR